MVKVKVEKKMNLLELIDWAWKNDVKGKSFNSKKQINALHFDMYGGIQTHCGIEKNDAFTVETEEEITEETEIPEMLEIFQDNDGTQWFGNSIEQLKDDFSREFWLKDGDTMTLIWKDGELVGDE